MKKMACVLALLFIVLTAGCTINHPVAIDYDRHLANYGAETVLSHTELDAEYFIADETKNHSYQFRAGSVGYAHLWIVEFGKILDQTLSADYVQSAFGKLKKSEGGAGNLIEFELEDFEFKNYRAYTTLNIKVLNSNTEIFNKTYRSEGGAQGGQMWVGGPFAMTNATLKSTKQSIDNILEEFINDVNSKNLASSE
ncbi:hypothetical protein [Marinimicrobium sp. ABcell2]|uniref:hypothetical protein n=1 Tax=Marinimicrobium sp. ABcell2 TaxID=3069751 RepID=UPI0027B5AE59|nr:hypothetical protein [Marinimicrobium sp. ABcell2]MDQ2077619.1 hypothetical protein [Marinimicrobium sp. ABcell2]